MDTTWATPKYFFENLNNEFNFTVDVCALEDTAKVAKFYSPAEDGLSMDWSSDVCFMNPPYGRGQDVYSWVKKAYQSSLEGGTVVCLLPLSGDTKWFHAFVMRSNEIRFVKDRIWFELDGKAARANHASMVVVFGGDLDADSPKISAISNGRIKKLSRA